MVTEMQHTSAGEIAFLQLVKALPPHGKGVKLLHPTPDQRDTFNALQNRGYLRGVNFTTELSIEITALGEDALARNADKETSAVNAARPVIKFIAAVKKLCGAVLDNLHKNIAAAIAAAIFACAAAIFAWVCGLFG